MAFLELRNVRVAGVSAGVPKNIVKNEGDAVQSKDYDSEAFVEMTGVKERRVSNTLTTSDLCYGAAEKLISDLGWNKSEIDALVFVSQTADYIFPASACILQDRLGLTKDCYAEDVALGCSGWVYGLSSVSSLVNTGYIKKALLLVGDAKLRVQGPVDPLFGNAGTVTAVEYVENGGTLNFHFGTDGSGFDAIIIPDCGCRNQVNKKSFEYEEIDGKLLNRLQTRMKGMDVFSFGISTAPKSVKKLVEYFGFDYLSYDYYVFHQANKKMNDMIKKKLKLDDEKVPSCMYNFGNTSSSSIPLTIVTQLRGKIENKTTKFICCGFGVGLSWGTVAFTTDEKFIISELIELTDDQIDEKHII